MTGIKRILIFYDYFAPAYKAGGPIRSLVNLVKLLESDFAIYVVSTNIDHDGTSLKVESDVWQSYGRSSQVMYLSAKQRKAGAIGAIISDVKPDIVYLNGMFSLTFQVYPLWQLRKTKVVKVVLAPRGMLQKEPLSIKPIKKQLYLRILRTLLLRRVNIWHVTTEQEMKELRSFTGNRAHVVEIGNVPSFRNDVELKFDLVRTNMVFGTVALISPMKNIHLILEAMAKMPIELTYKIYGPIKDKDYWDLCLDLINKLPDHIHCSYEGEIEPEGVADVISDLDFYIQPSRSENFGHAIFEAFNQGVPVITSDQTPWKDLKEKKAGWDVDLQDSYALPNAIEGALSLDDQQYLELRKGARRVADNYMKAQDFKKAYLDLFA